MADPTDATHNYHLLIVGFDGVETAARISSEVRHEGGLAGCEIEVEAIVSRDAAGQVRHHERGSAGIGATFGVVTGGVLGLLGGPVVLLVMLVTGAVLGGIAGHHAGQLLPPEDLRRVAEALPPENSAYVAVVDAAHASLVRDAFIAKGGAVTEIPVHTELANAIREALAHT